MSSEKEIARTFIRRLGTVLETTQVSEPRKRPVVHLQHITALTILIALYQCKSIFDLDQLARTKGVRALIGSRRDMVCSDSTIQRVLPLIDPEEQGRLLINSMNAACDHKPLMCQLDEHTQRSLGIVDGSCLFKRYWVTVLACTGEQGTFTQAIQPMAGKGHELKSAEELLIRQAAYLPEVLLCDGLYLCGRMMNLVCNKLGRRILIKYPGTKGNGECRQKEQEVIEQARHCLDNAQAYRDAIQTAEGYDRERMMHYRIEAIDSTYHEVPVTVLRVTENPKYRKPTQFWIVTSDTDLSLTAAREAAHQRWQIENNVWGQWSAAAGTKKVRTHSMAAALCLLFCIAVGVNLLTAVIRETKKMVRSGFPHTDKRTWKTMSNWLVNVIAQVTRRGCNVLNVV